MAFRLVTSLRKRLADWRYPEGYRIAARGGATWMLNHRHYVDRQMLFGGDYEAAQRQRLFTLAKDLGCRTFLDIGANFGLYSVHAALEGSFDAIHAFEPDPRNLACLRANMHLNGLLDGVIVHEIALSDRDGRISFAAGGDRFTGQSRVVPEKTIDSKEVEARRLDSLSWPDHGFCMKIDVEGHEIPVLEGSRGLLERKPWVIQVECLEGKGEGVGAFLTALGGTHTGEIGDDHYFVRRGGSVAGSFHG